MANILWIDDKAGGDTLTRQDKDGRRSTIRLGFDGLIHFIELNGHHVEIAYSGEHIESAVRSGKEYDLIILDIIMDSLPSVTKNRSQFGGFDALERLLETKLHIPIIILSVMSRDKIIDEANRREIDLEKSGVKEILRKGPILPMDLAELVERLLAENNNMTAGVPT